MAEALAAPRVQLMVTGPGVRAGLSSAEERTLLLAAPPAVLCRLRLVWPAPGVMASVRCMARWPKTRLQLRLVVTRMEGAVMAAVPVVTGPRGPRESTPE